MYGFSLSVWVESLVVKAVAPADGVISITVLQGSWEDKEYDIATAVKHGNTHM